MSRFEWGSQPLTVLRTTGAGIIISGPDTGYRVWITDIFINCATGTKAGLLAGLTQVFPEVANCSMSLEAPIRCTAMAPISVSVTGEGAVTVFLGYYIEKESSL